VGGVFIIWVRLNLDLLTEDLKRKRLSNDSFRLIGQPDVVVFSCEFLVVCGEGCRIGEWARFAELSGLGGVEEVNRLGWSDLFLYALLSQGRDVWHYLADQAGWDFHTGQYRRRAGQKLGRGIPTVSWDSARLAGGTGDLADDLEEFGISDRDGIRRAFERMRGNRQIVGRLEEIAATLNFPIGPNARNWKLTTHNWHTCTVHGFDYFDTRSGGVDSGGADRIAVWMLDPDYDGRSLFPEQVFFPMAGARDGWARLARNLKAEIDTDLIEAYRGTVSLPFEAGEHGRVAVKIVDDRGIESLKILELRA
jgi:adenine-specific DNA-methyltransferase